MSLSLPTPFPDVDISKDYNPAIRLFGKRFIKEQTAVEYLAEFLALVFSGKSIHNKEINTPLPSLEALSNWSKGSKLLYTLPIKLNLKLFAFLGGSRVDSRHDVHKEHFERLTNKLNKGISVSVGSKEDVIDWLEQFLRGYHGTGANRTWCAQTFYPISPSLITQETIWNESIARREPPSDWHNVISQFHKYFSVSKHRFMARGGELLYLQLCNLFTLSPEKVWEYFPSAYFANEEINTHLLHQSLQGRLAKMDSAYAGSFDTMVNFIDSLDKETQKLTNKSKDNLSCEWCPRESWPEGYLFAVELNRILGAVLDSIEKLELVKTGCALQVLRSLCAQSVRYSQLAQIKENKFGGTLGYAWLFSHPHMPTRQQRLSSQRNLQVVQTLIQQALRITGLVENAKQSNNAERLYREADNRYGHKLFLLLGKKLGIIAPYKGQGARFVMTDGLLRYLVTAILSPGERCTYEEFLIRLYIHYGIAVEGEQLTNSLSWSGLPANSSVQPSKGSWFAEMLCAGGFLTELSDACSIVCNTFHY